MTNLYVFYRKFKVQDAVPAPYSRDRKVLVGKFHLCFSFYLTTLKHASVCFQQLHNVHYVYLFLSNSFFND